MGCNQRKFVSLDFIAHKSTLYVPLNVAPINIVDKWNKTLFAGKPSPGELNWTMSGGYLTRKKKMGDLNYTPRWASFTRIIIIWMLHLCPLQRMLARYSRRPDSSERETLPEWEREREGEGIEISAGLLREIHSFFIRLHFLFMAARYELMDDVFFGFWRHSKSFFDKTWRSSVGRWMKFCLHILDGYAHAS